jgi:hypothetical protein
MHPAFTQEASHAECCWNLASQNIFEQRYSQARCFLAALTIVMLGWLSALGWVAARVAKLVIS